MFTIYNDLLHRKIKNSGLDFFKLVYSCFYLTAAVSTAEIPDLVSFFHMINPFLNMNDCSYVNISHSAPFVN